MSDTFTLRSVGQDGTVHEVEITPEQALDLGAGKPIAYVPRDEGFRVDEDGTITTRESAVPQYRES